MTTTPPVLGQAPVLPPPHLDSNSGQPPPHPDSLRQALPHLPLALGALLVLQPVFFGSTRSLFQRLVVSVASGQPFFASPAAIFLGLAPWTLFVALHLGLTRLLRAHGQLGLSDGQVAAMALTPGYNVLGTIELFTLEGAALSRLGGQAPTLAKDLRNGGLAATWLAALYFGVAVLDTDPGHGIPGLNPAVVGTLATILGLSVTVVRLLVLMKLREAVRRLEALPMPPEPILVPIHEPPRTWKIVAGLAICLLFQIGLRQVRPRGSTYESRLEHLDMRPGGALAGKREPATRLEDGSPPLAGVATASAASASPSDAAGPVAPAPTAAPPAPCANGDTLVGGRTITWWAKRLELLRGRTDPKGLEIYLLTKERAAANELSVLEVAGGVKVEPSEALLRACQEDRQ